LDGTDTSEDGGVDVLDDDAAAWDTTVPEDDASLGSVAVDATTETSAGLVEGDDALDDAAVGGNTAKGSSLDAAGPATATDFAFAASADDGNGVDADEDATVGAVTGAVGGFDGFDVGGATTGLTAGGAALVAALGASAAVVGLDPTVAAGAGPIFAASGTTTVVSL
jgi:hypothetical protein